MAEKRETQTLKRHESIYNEYLRIYEIESARHGVEFMTRLDKRFIYEKVAINLGWSYFHVRHVVNKMLKYKSVLCR